MAMNIKKGDTIVVLSGKDKGKQGKVLGTVPKSTKIVAEGINMVTCHVKPRRQGEEGGIVKREAAIAAFKLREEMPIGAKVTLRGDKMWEFLDRLFNVALPRVRDFQGINPNAFDGRGNYAMGIKEQLIFPEIEYDKIDKIRGMDIIIVTTAKTDEEGRALLQQVGAPFAR